MPATTEQKTRMEEIVGAARKVIDDADAKAGGPGKGTLTAEESAKCDAWYAEYDTLKATVDESEKQDRFRSRIEEHERFMSGSNGRRTDPDNGRKADPSASDAGKPLVLEFSGGRRTTIEAGTPEHHRASAEYFNAFMAYMTTGRPSSLLSTTKDDKAGYLAPPQMAAGMIRFLDNEVFMRQLATVLPPLTTGTSLGVLSHEADPDDADWTPEVRVTDLSEDTALSFGKREFVPHLCSKRIDVTRKLLRVASMDIQGFIRDRVGYKYAVTEEKAFLTGDGVKKPLGVFVASSDGVPTSRDVVCASATQFTADDGWDLLYGLKGQYLRNATGLFSREFVKRARKLKDGTGQYIWSPGLNAGQPALLWDRPFAMSEYVPSTFTPGLYVGMFADFKAGYSIVDSLQMEMDALFELGRLQNKVIIVAGKETDGQPVLAEAFSRLKLG